MKIHVSVGTGWGKSGGERRVDQHGELAKEVFVFVFVF